MLTAVTATGTAAATHWAVRRGHLQPFGSWSRWVRWWSDPLLRPVERTLVRMGRNPQDGPLWLLGGSVLFGILLLTFTRWLLQLVARVLVVGQAGPRAMAHFAVDGLFSLLMLALIIRVVSTWFGATRFSWLVRVAYRLTDWLVVPIRRLMPTLGPFDLSPLIGYLVLIFLRSLVTSLFR